MPPKEEKMWLLTKQLFLHSYTFLSPSQTYNDESRIINSMDVFKGMQKMELIRNDGSKILGTN